MPISQKISCLLFASAIEMRVSLVSTALPVALMAFNTTIRSNLSEQYEQFDSCCALDAMFISKSLNILHLFLGESDCMVLWRGK
jgi:hypothetical protein